MEDLFDSLIYIIIAIVGFVISAMGKKKKKNARKVVGHPKQQNPAPKKERPFLSNLEQLLNEELGIAEEKYENTYEVEAERVRQDQEPVLDSPVSEIDSVEDAIDSVPEEMLDKKGNIPYSIENDDTSDIFKDAIKDIEETDEEVNNEVLNDFNLEDAIVYSEIINRKEY